ncbi:NAD-dependent epimerase/dehydratase family protein [Pontibacter akesuensis]|uniref:Nucleoside-diphosphate-sugar epimerase n=1 Tax=Pontibacter akesuensis TaxID=388950 RepID=A0A1I7JK22_9BACT|nr:NAD-dependent epimerase/dehydratase family protein [Pontibacter akesuensis]GHA69412.1 NAD-dependent epimerase [Pontibacter akesuensis]SFU85534.1 Nucleoside-diphosphate-sugar epimerase [Pontibacter akesuensis]
MVFVTGGSGLIGSFLLAELLQRGYAVKALYRGQIPSIAGAAQVQWLEGDILDPALLRKAIEGVQYVFHCAGLVSYAPQDEELLKQVNIEGTANIVDACLEAGNVKLCHVSSIAAIGRPKNVEVLDEKSKWDPADDLSAYASSKYFAELEVWRGVAEGLDAVMVNPSIVLGPADWNRSSTQLFKYVYNENAFYTVGEANFVDVRDVVEAMLQLVLSDITGERFILNSERMGYKAFFEEVARCFGKKAPGKKVPPAVAEVVWRLEHVRSWFTGKRPLITKDTARTAKKTHLFSNNKISRALGFTFRPVSASVAWVCGELQAQQESGIRQGAE